MSKAEQIAEQAERIVVSLETADKWDYPPRFDLLIEGLERMYGMDIDDGLGYNWRLGKDENPIVIVPDEETREFKLWFNEKESVEIGVGPDESWQDEFIKKSADRIIKWGFKEFNYKRVKFDLVEQRIVRGVSVDVVITNGDECWVVVAK